MNQIPGLTIVLVGLALLSSRQLPKSAPTIKATILVFLNTECPVSQQYTRTLIRLHQQYQQQVRFVALYPSPTDSARAIRVFHQAYGLAFRGLPDRAHTYVARYHAQTTPEVVLLDAAGHVVYQGAIDDGYITLGRRRPSPTQFFLQDALTALLDKRPILTSRTTAVGCLIE